MRLTALSDASCQPTLQRGRTARSLPLSVPLPCLLAYLNLRMPCSGHDRRWQACAVNGHAGVHSLFHRRPTDQPRPQAASASAGAAIGGGGHLHGSRAFPAGGTSQSTRDGSARSPLMITGETALQLAGSTGHRQNLCGASASSAASIWAVYVVHGLPCSRAFVRLESVPYGSHMQVAPDVWSHASCSMSRRYPHLLQRLVMDCYATP